MANIVERYFDEALQKIASPSDHSNIEVPFPEHSENEGFDPTKIGGKDDRVVSVGEAWAIENATRGLVGGSDGNRVGEEDRRLLDGAIREVGLEVYAFYKSRRYLNRPPYKGKWGIFYLAHGVSRIAELIALTYPGYSDPYSLAYKFLRAHERFHFVFDVYALGAESLIGKARYEPMKNELKNHWAGDLEEALANKEAWIWAQKKRVGLEEFAFDFMKLQPGAYARFDENKRELTGELAANFLDLDFSSNAYRADQALWVGKIPPEFTRQSLCPEYFVYVSDLSSWIRPAWRLPEVREVKESESVIDDLDSKYRSTRKLWEKTKEKLLANPALPGLHFKRWDKDSNQWSVRLDRKFRAHLTLIPKSTGVWEVNEIGTHKAMGHG